VLLETWQEIDSVEWEMLQNVTFADLVERSRGRTEKMYYI
jgi:hypothetical protein